MTNAGGDGPSSRPPRAAASLEASPGAPLSAAQRAEPTPTPRTAGVRNYSDRLRPPPLLWLPLLALVAWSAWQLVDYIRTRGLNESEAASIAGGVQLIWSEIPIPPPYSSSVPRVVTTVVDPKGPLLTANDVSPFWRIESEPLQDSHGSLLSISDIIEACQPLLTFPGTKQTSQPKATSKRRFIGKTERPSVVVESTVAVYAHAEEARISWEDRSELPPGDFRNCGSARGERASVVERTANRVHVRFSLLLEETGDPLLPRHAEVHSVYLVGSEATAHLVVIYTATTQGEPMTRSLIQALERELARVEAR